MSALYREVCGCIFFHYLIMLKVNPIRLTVSYLSYLSVNWSRDKKMGLSDGQAVIHTHTHTHTECWSLIIHHILLGLVITEIVVIAFIDCIKACDIVN
jgi:hypothetical protein